ncbi:MAG TPA: twin-arginine translocase TatA/TatE family subunit [Chthoniobacterales bacterium]
MNNLLALTAPGWPEIMMILFFVLIFFGAKKLPELARSIGQSMHEFKKAKDEFSRELNRPAEENSPQTPAAPPVAIAEAKDKEVAHKPA